MTTCFDCGARKGLAAIALLEAKGYAQSRFNPKNRYDGTKQYRLVPDRFAADLEQFGQANGPQRPGV